MNLFGILEQKRGCNKLENKFCYSPFRIGGEVIDDVIIERNRNLPLKLVFLSKGKSIGTPSKFGYCLAG